MPDVKIIIGWDKSELGKERELANSSVEAPPDSTSKIKCLPMFLIYQPEDGQWKGSKYVVVLYVINYTYLYHHIVVLDKYTNSSLVYYKHNGDDEPCD